MPIEAGRVVGKNVPSRLRVPNVSSTIIGVPFIQRPGVRRQYWRVFQSDGSMPKQDMVAFIASIVRDGLNATKHPDGEALKQRLNDWLVQQVELVIAVPDDVWDRHGLFPLGDWQPEAAHVGG